MLNPDEPREPVSDLIARLRPIAVLIVIMMAAGALLGVVWAWWSPPVPAGVQVGDGLQRQESEAFLSADARFVLIAVVVGAVSGIGAWLVRSARGPGMVLGLVGSALAGAWLTGVVGNAVGGGTDDAPTGIVISHLELHLQLTSGYYVEAAIAVLCYALLVAFAPADDLGRPDPAYDAARRRRDMPPPPAELSVGAQGGEQDARRHGDGPGLAQQHDFPAQEPH